MKNLPVSVWLKILISIECIFLFSGCNKIIDWGKKNFAQTQPYANDFVRAAQPYLRSSIVYYEFTTEATFHAIFLTDQMRMIFVDYHKQCYGLNPEQELMTRKRMINENKYFVSFYVIGEQKEHIYDTGRSLFNGNYQKQTELLGSKDATWNVTMRVGNKEYAAESIRVVELPMEFRNFFGKNLDQFCSTYLVRFPIQDAHERLIFEPSKKYNVTLHFVSPIYQTDMTWKSIVYSKG